MLPPGTLGLNSRPVTRLIGVKLFSCVYLFVNDARKSLGLRTDGTG
jgi:hypothetical protein